LLYINWNRGHCSAVFIEDSITLKPTIIEKNHQIVSITLELPFCDLVIGINIKEALTEYSIQYEEYCFNG